MPNAQMDGRSMTTFSLVLRPSSNTPFLPWITMVENNQKSSIISFFPISQCLKIIRNVAYDYFLFWHFPSIFVLLKLTCLVTLFSGFPNLAKNWPFLFNFCKRKVARFARNIEWEFSFWIFAPKIIDGFFFQISESRIPSFPSHSMDFFTFWKSHV